MLVQQRRTGAAVTEASDTPGVVLARRKAKPDHPLTLQELHEALSDSHIHARYQPIVTIADHRPVGLEVLARLEHPTRGTLPPDLFVPPIKDAGLAWPLTKAVVRRAFADWTEGGLGRQGLWLSLNFPIDVLLDAAALDWVERRRLAAGIPAGRLIVELTESRPVTRIDELRAAVERLRGLGYGLAIDDVGPNIRDHRALLDLPFTHLKLDKDLVRESQDSPTSQDFLLRTIEAARAASLAIVAEGVEDHEIWAHMKALDVNEAQGFLIARPLPAVAVPTWHRDWHSRHRLPAPPPAD